MVYRGVRRKRVHYTWIQKPNSQLNNNIQWNLCVPPLLEFSNYQNLFALYWPQFFKSWMALSSRAQLFKRWITLSTGQVTIHWIAQLVPVVLIRWIVIYPVDSAIQRLSNPGQVNHYPVDKCEGNQLRFPVDSDLSGGESYLPFEQLWPAL